MLTCPNTPTLEELQAFRNSPDAVHTARRLKGDLRRAVTGLRAEALLALALQHFPGEAPEQALKKFGLEVMATLHELSKVGCHAQALRRAEDDRISPLTQAAAKRLLTAAGRVMSMPRLIELERAAVQRKRKELAAMDVEDPSFIEKLAPANGVKALEDEQRALEAEIAALEEFMRTKDETLLPPGIKPFDQAASDEARRLGHLHYLQQTVGGAAAAA
ncbi:MAG: hypothetical protein M0R28_08300 [Pigmentiphaga sp.]|nr:hypothetical protein [Pigmentiphaga sp.]